ncbi:cell division protein FtsX [Leptothoe kymatousa]|uniref:Cell division protein FtsX n=1 Tax=Leptothoe kymatousa TAU-MAC 1615 TaxID=2364775 RepID=A0ABS5Y385_9CYAN|nr:ABC transporter permease [Leptothoe kymatousa]MBT9312285.1 ABC transporter permease [Leptothoe kymatousa TAU-MAC 1615]
MGKFFTKASYLLRETLLGLQRGGWMNWAAVSTIMVLLFLFGVSLQATWQVESLLNQFGSQLEIAVYLDSGVAAESLSDRIRNLPEVAEVVTVSKEDAWTTLSEELGITDIEGATEQLKGNPLVDEIKVKVKASDSVPAVATQLENLAGVDEVLYITEAVQRLTELNQGLQYVSMGVLAILSLTAIAVITTTIRLIVMARRREIEVMQLVGATSIWIYMPFILQGITFGLMGAFIAWALLVGTHQSLQRLSAQQPEFLQFLAVGLEFTPKQLLLLPTSLFALGSLVGLLGSLVAVRKFAAMRP